MSKPLKWTSTVSIFVVAVAYCLRLMLTPVSGEVRHRLCPTAFAAVEDPLVKTPTQEESGENLSFEYFCTLITRDHPNLKSLHREIISSDQSVTIILFAYFDGEDVDKPVRTVTQVTPPSLSKFRRAPPDPRFDDTELVLPLEKDGADVGWGIFFIALVTLILEAVVLFWDYPM